MESCLFQENVAFSGGVVKISNLLPDFQLNNYVENVAYYGNEFASYPIRMNYSSIICVKNLNFYSFKSLFIKLLSNELLK